MMKPYSQWGLGNEERIFNYRLSCARRVVGNAFGILANHFQVLLTTMQHSPNTVNVIIKACVVLHNLMRIQYPGLQNQQLDLPAVTSSEEPRQDRNLEDRHTVAGSNSANKKGKKLRNLLKHWVNSPAGAVLSQDMMI